MNYFDTLKHTMEELSQIKDVIFLGQAVKVPGTAMYNTLKDVLTYKKIEMPVTENMQLGMSIGLALQGYLPISVFPRWNFLLSATDQIVNHLDKLEEMSCGDFAPKVIIRVGVGSRAPLYPGEQHLGDFSSAFSNMCRNILVVRLERTIDIQPEYQNAVARRGSTILVEYMDEYNE